ncbi:MAG: cell envelope integrity protein TolA [Gammaproteobacteria bacterium]
MLSFVRQYRVALLWSLLLHAVLASVLTFSALSDLPFAGAPAPQVAIEATVVDSGRIEQEMRRLENAEQQEIQEREAEAQRLREEAEAARLAKQEEERRLQALQEEREQAELRRQQELAEQRRADEEAERLQAAQEEADRQRQAELEAQQQAEAERRQEELRRQQEAERERLAELERQRKAEEERLARLEAERQEQERQQREAALQRELAEEERRMAAEASGLLDEYQRLIEQQIERNWVRPPGAAAGLDCTVQVTQIPNGEVVGVRVGTCNGDAAVVRSIEAAVYRASPLPLPRDPTLFDRNLTVTFRPDS